jgi:hypothetical protein
MVYAGIAVYMIAECLFLWSPDFSRAAFRAMVFLKDSAWCFVWIGLYQAIKQVPRKVLEEAAK